MKRYKSKQVPQEQLATRKEHVFNGKGYFRTVKEVQFPAINAAKRASREFQESNGGLGRGSVRVL